MNERHSEESSNERANFESWCCEIAPAIYESVREAMWQAWKARSRRPVETTDARDALNGSAAGKET